MSSLITARTLMALAVHHNLPIAHADIPQAFVQSVLKRPIYCKFPQGVEICPKLLAHVQAKHPNAIEFNWNEITEITLRLKERAYVLVARTLLYTLQVTSSTS